MRIELYASFGCLNNSPMFVVLFQFTCRQWCFDETERNVLSVGDGLLQTQLVDIHFWWWRDKGQMNCNGRSDHNTVREGVCWNDRSEKVKQNSSTSGCARGKNRRCVGMGAEGNKRLSECLCGVCERANDYTCNVTLQVKLQVFGTDNEVCLNS